jgi:hypothetical protein
MSGLDHDQALLDRIVAGGFIGDPPADALVAAFRAMPGGKGWQMLERALSFGVENVKGAPPELHALLEPLLDPPDWVDFELADAGALAYWRTGAFNLQLALTCGALAYGYQSARLVRPLAATGRLEKMAPRRLGETSRWVLSATEPGGMRLGAEGFRASVRLRMVHALVRDHLLRSDDWDFEEWGVPISASDQLVTATGGFFLVPLTALQDLGARFSDADVEAITHLWRWIGYVLGVPEEMLARNRAEAIEILEASFALDGGPNEDSPRLMRALLHHGSSLPDTLPSFLAGPARQAMALWLGGFTRRWMGDDMADKLDVPRTPLTHIAPLLRPANALRNAVLATGLFGSDERIAAFELALVRRALAQGRAPEHMIQPSAAAEEPVLDAA